MVDLVVEDGTGLENADSYVSLDTVVDYATRYGRSDFLALGNDAKGSRVRNVCQQMDSMYKWPSCPLNPNQWLAFPRIILWVDGTQVSGVPVQVKRAALELATYPGLPDIPSDFSVSEYKQYTSKLDTLSESYVYRDDPVIKFFQVAESMLSPLTEGLLKRGGGVSYNSIQLC